MSAPPPSIDARKCQQIADVLYGMLIGPRGLLTDPKLPYDLRWLVDHSGVNLYVPGAEPVYIALSVQTTIDEQKYVIHLLQQRMLSHGYQRYCSVIDMAGAISLCDRLRCYIHKGKIWSDETD
jgi:hypothetical protein